MYSTNSRCGYGSSEAGKSCGDNCNYTIASVNDRGSGRWVKQTIRGSSSLPLRGTSEGSERRDEDGTNLLVLWVFGADDVYPPLPLDNAAPVAHGLDGCADLHAAVEYDVGGRRGGERMVRVGVEVSVGERRGPDARK